LIYNGGEGTAADLCWLIAELKNRVARKFGIQLEKKCSTWVSQRRQRPAALPE